MSKKNLIMINSMMRLSRIIRNSKDARRNLDLVVDQTGYFIVAGESSNMIQVQAKASISNILFVEQYLRSSVSSICVHLDGFDPGRMDPIDYISSNDIKNGIDGVKISRTKEQVQIEKLLQAIEKNPFATQAYYAEQIGVSKRTVSRIFVSLQQNGVLVQNGTNRKSNWVIIK